MTVGELYIIFAETLRKLRVNTRSNETLTPINRFLELALERVLTDTHLFDFVVLEQVFKLAVWDNLDLTTRYPPVLE